MSAKIRFEYFFVCLLINGTAVETECISLYIFAYFCFVNLHRSGIVSEYFVSTVIAKLVPKNFNKEHGFISEKKNNCNVAIEIGFYYSQIK